MFRKTSFLFIGGFAMALLLICAGQLLADEILLENGDKLTGTVVKSEGGKLILKTDYAGPIEIQMDKVKRIVTDNPADVHLIGGEVLKGKIKTTEDGKLIVEQSPERAASAVEWNKVAAINPPPSRRPS